MNAFKTLSIIAVGVASLSLTACQKTPQETTDQASHVETLRIGFQKSAINLLVTRQQKLLEQQFPHATVEWKEFPAGPQMLEALAVGAVDYGYVGNTPPIFAQSAGKALNYVGYEAYSGQSIALVTPANSAIETLEQLKGKRIAVQKGSNAHEFLAKVLQKSGLTWSDIQPIWLPPADARAAFDKQSIDAWAIWDPFLSSAEQDAQARTLINGAAFPQSYTYFVGSPQFIHQYPQASQKFIESLNQADQWISSHPEQTQALYSQYTGLSAQIAKTVLERRLRPSVTAVLTPDVVKSQQAIADLFHQEALIPQKIDVQLNVWTPATHN